eukprot:Skav211161  [mRNA]  locus=scaffold413:491559:492770:+ [translate_table: standard]
MLPHAIAALLLTQRAFAIRSQADLGQLQREAQWHAANGTEGVATRLAICGRSEGMPGMENHLLHCEFQLSKLRKVFGVPDADEILKSNQIDLAKAEEGAGKSGARMLFSKDKKYIIKTMSKRDLEALGPVINLYASHILGHSKTSEMMRLYAIIEDPQGGFWSIGNNWLPVNFPITWDLKGSLVGRESGKTSPSQKDKDWLVESKALAVPAGQRASILQALESDSSMLARSRLIDYSLIVGLLVYDLEACDGPNQRKCIAPICHPQGGCGETAYTMGSYFRDIKKFYCSKRGRSWGPVKERELGHTCVGSITKSMKIYFQCFGIIDLLKPFDLKSRLEYAGKGGFARKVSAQPPDAYAKRFMDFMQKQVFPKQLAETTAPLIFTAETCQTWGSIELPGQLFGH